MNPNLSTKVKIILGIETVIVLILGLSLIVVTNMSCDDGPAHDVSSKLLIEETEFGHTSKHEVIKKYTLKYNQDFMVELISFGAAIKSIHAKCKHNHLNNRVLGFNTIQGIHLTMNLIGARLE